MTFIKSPCIIFLFRVIVTCLIIYLVVYLLSVCFILGIAPVPTVGLSREGIKKYLSLTESIIFLFPNTNIVFRVNTDAIIHASM